MLSYRGEKQLICDGIEYTEYKYMRDYPSTCGASGNEQSHEFMRLASLAIQSILSNIFRTT